MLKDSTPEFLKKVARKGRLAVRFLKSYHKHRAVIEKTIWQKLPEKLVKGVAGGLGAIGSILILSGLIPLVWKLRKRRER